MHPISRRHLVTLDDELGANAELAARGLQVDLLHARTLGWNVVAESARAHLALIEASFDEPRGTFRNVRQADGEWDAASGTNLTLGRVMLALGETIEQAPDAKLVERSVDVFGRAMKAAGRTTLLRAQASVVLACAAVLGGSPLVDSEDPRDRDLVKQMREVMRRLATVLHARILDGARPQWPWPESTLTQEGAIVARAMIVAGRQLGAEVMTTIGIQVLNWLIDIQTVPGGHLSPIGTGGWPMGGDRPTFDQEPIDATDILLAAEAAYDATGDPRYRLAVERAYAWFLGANDLGRPIANPRAGACGTALTAAGVDRTRGAAPTLQWLIAAEHIRALRGAVPRRVMVLPRGRAPQPAPSPSAPGIR